MICQSLTVSEWVRDVDRRSKHIIWIVFLLKIEQALIVPKSKPNTLLFFLIQKADVSAFKA